MPTLLHPVRASCHAYCTIPLSYSTECLHFSPQLFFQTFSKVASKNSLKSYIYLIVPAKSQYTTIYLFHFSIKILSLQDVLKLLEE